MIAGSCRRLRLGLLLCVMLGMAARSPAEVKLIVPAGYLPGVPFLARVEVRDNSGARDWNLWNGDAFLSVDQPGISLSTNRVVLRNGLGTALLTFSGSANLNLTATVNGEVAARAVTNRSGQPVTTVSGTLPGTSTTWSGIVNVTGDVTVPSGHTLTIQSNTLVRINGVSSGTSAADIIVNGTIQSLGTEQYPVTITCSDPNLNWGQIRHDNAQASIYQYTFITKAGRAPGEGHTGTGSAIRPNNSTITFDGCVISDITAAGSTIGKIMMASGSTLMLRNCALARARMGPEIAGTGLLCTNSYIMEMNGPDDADGIYLHDSAGRSLTLSGCVLAGGDDDAIDTLDSDVTVENCILRDWPNPNEDAKGVSAFHGEVHIRRCLIANCFVGVSAKSSGPLAVVRIDHCTINGNTQGVSAATKANASAGNINFYMTNSIVRSADAVYSDFGPDKFVSVTYCDLSESWPGAGNITTDPLFVNTAAGDFHLQPGSPCVDAGDPTFAPDPDGSRTEMGFYAAQSQSGGLFVSITSPASGALLAAPANITISAIANSATSTVTRVEFFEGGMKLGEDAANPYSFAWGNVPVGIYTLRAVATQLGGLTATSAPVTVSVTSGEGPSTNILVAAGSDWKYLDDGTDQGTNWTRSVFNDGAWKLGKAQLGYGDGDEATIIGFGPNANNKYLTYYFRRTFVMDDPARVNTLTLNLLRDDGAIVYLNGQEAHRVGMPAGAVNYRTLASDTGENNRDSASVNKNLLVSGANLVAVEVHQASATSSDISFDLELVAVLSTPTNAKPLVAITGPADNTTFGAPATVTITANAQDPDGAVTNVAFYANGAKLGDDTANPYAFSWNNVAVGNYTLTAVATDATGLSATSSVVTITVSTNTAPPRIASQSPPPGPVTNLTAITVNFTKPIIGVDAADLLINGIPATGVSGSGSQYTFTFTPPAPGTRTVSWSPSHGITDTFIPPNAFDANAPGAVWQYQFFDSTPPVVQSLTPPARSTVTTLTSIVVTFTEAVTGVNASDLLINSTPATGFSGSGAGPYTFAFPQPAQGTVVISWSGSHGIRDLGNSPFGGGSWNYVLNSNQVGIVISEIMYHPISENPLEEFIELFNREATPVNLNGWRLRDAAEFTFTNVTIPAGGYLVVAANLATFKSKYPSVANVVGNWTGFLSNSREDIDLDDARGNRIDSVRYADEGDWAIRRRGIQDRGYRGWRWFSEHDGLEKSAELINPKVSNNSGQNWASSLVAGGTPGAANSVSATNIAPLIRNVAHFPLVPKSTESVLITAEVSDESDVNLPVTLSHRADSTTPPPFSVTPMHDDGLNGDAAASDGIFSVVLPAQPNNTVVEFYLSASDRLGNARTWPAPAIAAEDGTGPTGQVANALYQVDDTDYTGTQPLYKIIMTEVERAELQQIDDNIGGAANSDAQMNATFIGIDGTGSQLRYLIGVRNRGHGTRAAKPNNFRFNFRSDDEWKGVTALNINAQFTWLQVFGAALHTRSGIVGAYSRAVQVRVNNANLAFSGPTDRTYGSYAANESIDADWADRHFPNDSDGNVYRALRDLVPSDFDYRTQAAYPGLFGPEDKSSYTNTWFKETNASEDNWTDLFAMLRVFGLNGTEPFTPENVRRVINAEQWMRHLAIMNLLGNSETGLNSGYNDDYFMYRGVNDPRFILMYYDLDQIVGFNGAFAPNSTIFSATSTGNLQRSGPAFDRFMHHPEFEPIYYAMLKDLIETSFSASQFNALVDSMLGDFVPDATRSQIKNWMDARRTFVQSQLPVINVSKPPVAVVTGVPRSPTPRPTVSLNVGGEGVTHYRFALNGGAFGAETPVATPISLSSLANGANTVAVIGRDAAGLYQATTNATLVSWVVNTAWPTVRLNELIASRSGNLPDQIELFNEGAATVNLSGLRLTDNPGNPNKFTFGSASLAAGAYLALDATQLSFAFDKSGEGLFLFDTVARGSALLDSVAFGLQLTDFSIGRIGQSGEWQLTQPSFGSANVLQPLGDSRQIKINEWLTFGVSPYPDDFVELYNPEALPVAVGGFYLTDQAVGAPMRGRIAPVSFISAKGFAVFTSGDGDRADEISFNLAAEQGEIALLAPELSVIDAVIYGPQRTGVSTGRCPDGDLALKSLVAPTPGGPNQCPFIPPQPLAITLIAYTNVWRYNASGTDLGTTWKETNYNDSAWSAGPGLLGFENNALPEPLLTPFTGAGGIPTFYFRTLFRVDPSLAASSVQITHLIDDGAAFYLNGQEIGSRYNLPAGATFQTFASATVEASYQTFTIPINQLRPGTNLFAVEVHQVNQTSTDLVFGMKLDALVVTNSPIAAGIVINEVFANNATLVDSDGNRPDWIELYNPSSNAVDVAGASLTDDISNARRWVFPSGSLVPASGFLKVRLNPDALASATNTGFGLNANGGAVYLFNRPQDGGGLQSSAIYGLQPPDWTIGRVPDGSTNWVLNLPTLGIANIAASLGNPQLLKINEWLAAPNSGDDWFEIFNPNPEPVALGGLWLSDSLTDRLKHQLPPLSFIGNGGYAFQKFTADGNLSAGGDHVGFNLNASGEALAISTASGVLIDGVSFGPQLVGVSQGRLLDGGANVVNFASTPSPGSSNFLPLEDVVINELLSHSDPPFEDAVELHNPGTDAVDLSGWFLSDSVANLRKYQIPTNTVVPPGGYLVLYEYQFNGDDANEPFSFSSARGDEVYLSQAVNGVLTGYRAFAAFGPAENGVSYGRLPTSQGFDFVAMAQRTFGRDNPATTNEFRLGKGAANSSAKIGPVVINEIMYQPASTNDALEFVELRNVTSAAVPLSDTNNPANTWRLRNGIDFDFPQGVSIPMGGYLVVISFNPQTDAASLAAFQSAYGSGATLIGPYNGKLANSGETVELQKPDPPETLPGPDFGLVPYVVVDRIAYTALPPWPSSAAGTGQSLQKTSPSLYGNEPLNWVAATPTPGRANAGAATDTDNDGMPDDWENQYMLNRLDPSDASADPDGDGLTNLQEYLAGTNPRNAQSTLKFEPLTSANFANGTVTLYFNVVAGKTYRVEYRDSLTSGAWTKLKDVSAQPTSGVVPVTDSSAGGAGTRYYRLITPATP